MHSTLWVSTLLGHGIFLKVIFYCNPSFPLRRKPMDAVIRSKQKEQITRLPRSECALVDNCWALSLVPSENEGYAKVIFFHFNGLRLPRHYLVKTPLLSHFIDILLLSLPLGLRYFFLLEKRLFPITICSHIIHFQLGQGK